ncbi:cytochrome P450 [Lasiosphaeria miniovina]|uniref:Cytochrome P450 n=1 Tax=Lasiosphaeria miniovina TaxID=1954250 RepID=A0AA40DV04_9PEZI|nr:cytochrome P450 [Lasiosphaeria miniovina]KAK0714186.1 cytochrome P450 [Lasiosphaeria miniovina]
MTDMRGFLSRASAALSQRNIVRFRLGPMKIYLVKGAKNVQTMFKTPASVSADKFLLIVMEGLMAADRNDLAKFAKDKSGRLKTNATDPANTQTGDESASKAQADRYWYRWHRILHDHLVQTQATNLLAASYQKHFSEFLDDNARFPVEQWTAMRLLEFTKKDVAEAAIYSLFGPRILELNPDLLPLLWDFDEVAGCLAWGLPRWMNRKAYRRRSRFHATSARFLDSAWAGFDWSGPDSDADWEPHFGSRMIREVAKFLAEAGFSPGFRAGFVATLVYGQNGNTVPIVTWCIMELVKDPELFRAVRAEVLTAIVMDPETQKRAVDLQALLPLPVLQSVYTEALRMHVSINVTREIMEPIVLEGHRLERGAILQAPSEIIQYDEKIWSAGDSHPASEFWAGRHLKHVKSTDEAGNVVQVPQFDLAGRVNDFIAYGGGVAMCPGRFFAKREIMITITMLVSRFDMEFVGWTTLDGGPSDRPARNDDRWAGGAAVPPDRDMKVRVKKLW